MKFPNAPVQVGRLVAGLVAAVLAYSAPGEAQTPTMGLASEGTTIAGTVTDIFGNKFVLDGNGQRILVETGPEWYQRLDIRPGEAVTIIGAPNRGAFDAFRIIRADGRVLVIRQDRTAAPPLEARTEPPASRGIVSVEDARRLAAEAGFGAVTRVKRKRYHYEIETRDMHGHEAEVHVTHDGRVSRIEFEDEETSLDDFTGLFNKEVRDAVRTAGIVSLEEVQIRPDRIRIEGHDGADRKLTLNVREDGSLLDRNSQTLASPELFRRGWDQVGFDAERLRRSLASAGYRITGEPLRHPKHFEVSADNPYKERVELHIDLHGEVYKERWLR